MISQIVKIKTILAFLFLFVCGHLLQAQIVEAQARDIRTVQIQAGQAESMMKEKAEAELEAAKEDTLQRRKRLSEDKTALENAIASAKQQVSQLKKDIDILKGEQTRLKETEIDLSQKIKNSDGMIRELTGLVRLNAKDLSAFLADNLQSPIFWPDTQFLDDIGGESRFPGMDDISKMTDLVFEQIQNSGTVSLETAEITDRLGRPTEAQVLLIGSFSAFYKTDGEAGFLNHTTGGNRLFALSRLPSARMQKSINSYLDGESDSVFMDISRGAALKQLTHELRWYEQISNGGPIVWPILAIFAVGCLIVLERIGFLTYRKINVDKVCQKIEQKATDQKWEDCRKVCTRYTRNPVVRVIQAGLKFPELAREEMENTLQEAILKEIPSMERFLSTLGMLAAIAPLLGLLGTVTGMIDTFHVITLHGTGDPRMMSGGISEALVTTMLGLSVAIPIMLAHTLLARSVENTIALMEEKAVALVNIIQRTGDI